MVCNCGGVAKDISSKEQTQPFLQVKNRVYSILEIVIAK